MIFPLFILSPAPFLPGLFSPRLSPRAETRRQFFNFIGHISFTRSYIRLCASVCGFSRSFIDKFVVTISGIPERARVSITLKTCSVEYDVSRSTPKSSITSSLNCCRAVDNLLFAVESALYPVNQPREISNARRYPPVNQRICDAASAERLTRTHAAVKQYPDIVSKHLFPFFRRTACKFP